MSPILSDNPSGLGGGTQGTSSLTSNSRAANAAQRSDNSLIPLINIIFLLLIFYMIAGQICYSDGATIDVPISNSEKQLVPPELQLSIDADGVITVNGASLDATDINTALDVALGPYPNRAISIKADKQVRAKQLSDLLLALKSNGVTSIALFSTANEDL